MDKRRWTVATSSINIELPNGLLNEVEVFYTEKEAVDYFASMIKFAEIHGWKVSQTEDKDKSILIKCFDEDRIMLVSRLRCHKNRLNKK